MAAPEPKDRERSDKANSVYLKGHPRLIEELRASDVHAVKDGELFVAEGTVGSSSSRLIIDSQSFRSSEPHSHKLSTRFSSRSLALLARTLFLSASYCLCVLSMLMLRLRATFTKAVINFMAAENHKVKKHA
ncbi:hypothetical protein EYF80_000991 [Liparis tanakae]|uniref:Uncharacterized protein n=1 Tax=Liparis tanakae TaxID=230148 RepID=A0A4Z2JEH5_9TELE|nr:hypothetical protein EYF80_000991 [Liparis tanakae]